MYYKTIELYPKQDKIAYDEIKDLLWHFLFTLECNGQILKNYKVIEKENYLLYVTTPKQDSLDEKYDGCYVKKDKEEILKYFNLQITDCGIDLESQSYCYCKKRTAMEMQTYRFDIDSVFTCCDCGKPIALYELPYPKDSEDYCDIQLWQDNYAAMDMLWINCLCDRHTGNQRVKFDSALNKQGIELAEYMSKQLNYPVYYHLACDYGKSIKTEKVNDKIAHICPKCEKTMNRIKFSEDHERDICKNCNLSFDAH